MNEFGKIFRKVKEKLIDEELISSIIETYGESVNEPIIENELNMKKRLLELIAAADITLDEYERALSYTDTGFK